jgi:hypothetical protein
VYDRKGIAWRIIRDGYHPWLETPALELVHWRAFYSADY